MSVEAKIITLSSAVLNPCKGKFWGYLLKKGDNILYHTETGEIWTPVNGDNGIYTYTIQYLEQPFKKAIQRETLKNIK